MLKTIRNSVSLLLLMTLILGLGYPLVMTGVAGALFPNQAKGSMVSVQGAPVGSALIGQNFTKAEYFHGRPSAAGKEGYDATASGGSNLGPTSKKLKELVEARVEEVRKENGLSSSTPVPSDLVMASGSGLDPHISPESAMLQVKRIAMARSIQVEDVEALVQSQTEQPIFSFLGEPRVNVLKLNIALDKMVK